MRLHINVPSGSYHAPESGQRNQRFEQRDAAPSPERSAEQRKDRDQHEKVALNDAKRAGIFAFDELEIERSANEPKRDHSEQDQQSSFATNSALVVVHGEVVQGVVHIFRIVREKST
jgi:type IV secretory pathway VirB10-like protein